MQTKILLLFITCALGVEAMGQQKKFTVGLGYQRTWMLDKQASPLKYQTREKTLLLGYDRTGNKGIFSAQLNGAFGDFFPTGFESRQMYDQGYNHDGTPKKDSFSIPGTLYTGRIKLGYLWEATGRDHEIGNGKLYSRNYFGTSLNNQMFYSDNIVRVGWLNAASLNAEYLQTVLLNEEHFLSVKFSVPLLSQNARLAYHNSISSSSGENNIKTFFKQGSRFAWPGNFQNIQLEAGYEYSVSRHLSIGIKYFGQWLHYTKAKPINIIQNNLGFTASFK